MNDLNSVFMVGRLKGDPKLTDKKSSPVLSFTIANNYSTFDEDKKEYIKEAGLYDVILFGKQGEKILPYLKKGNRIGVNGRLNENIIIAYTIQLLDSKKNIQTSKEES